MYQHALRGVGFGLALCRVWGLRVSGFTSLQGLAVHVSERHRSPEDETETQHFKITFWIRANRGGFGLLVLGIKRSFKGFFAGSGFSMISFRLSLPSVFVFAWLRFRPMCILDAPGYEQLYRRSYQCI